MKSSTGKKTAVWARMRQGQWSPPRRAKRRSSSGRPCSSTSRALQDIKRFLQSFLSALVDTSFQRAYNPDGPTSVCFQRQTVLFPLCLDRLLDVFDAHVRYGLAQLLHVEFLPVLHDQKQVASHAARRASIAFSQQLRSRFSFDCWKVLTSSKEGDTTHTSTDLNRYLFVLRC